ncbi:MAG: hypothetical protein QOE35_3529 [Actinomycetota bacterium]|jgi:uncharacterized glyoxalase superfamily protein PhnB
MDGMSDLYVRLAYESEEAGAEWLVRVFGFREYERKVNPGGSTLIWLEHDGGVVMICRVGLGLHTPRQLGGTSQKVNVYVADVDAHHAHATAEGAVVERPLETTPYGERRYEVIDPDGHWWHFTQRL